MPQHMYGWIPDHPDHRDLCFGDVRVLEDVALPPSVDLRPQMPPIFDQLALGSCTANAACAVAWYTGLKEGHQLSAPSRLFEYYNSRLLQGTLEYDSGASIRVSIKAMARYGFCPETDWVYDISKFKQTPPTVAYNDAKPNIVRIYHSVPQRSTDIKAALAQGLPVDFGFTVYESFESDEVAKTGMVPYPKPGERVLGGHAVVLVGYDDSRNLFITRNSWGTGWGDKGYFYFPYNYVLNGQLSSDFWVINAVP